MIQGIDFTEVAVGNYTLPEPFNITIVPKKIVFPPMYPGDSQTGSFSIVNNGVLAYIGVFQGSLEVNMSNQTQNVDWVTFSPTQFELLPNQTTNVNVTVKIPKNYLQEST